MTTVFTILHLIVSILLIVIVLLQEGKDPGLRGIVGSTPDMGDSFFNKHSGRTKASILSKFTVVLAVLFLITTMSLVFLK